jgi:hypothetical protein
MDPNQTKPNHLGTFGDVIFNDIVVGFKSVDLQIIETFLIIPYPCCKVTKS